jgi:hypothetical protein
MADQATKKRATVSVPAETAPVTGRAKPKTADYSKFRQTFRQMEDFSRYLAGYPDKRGLLGYLYRLTPKIDNSLIGRSDSSIRKLDVGEMTAEFVQSNFGRGKYMLKLTDANRVKGENEVAKTFIECVDPDFPSVYDPRTLLLGDPENADEIARLLQSGVLVRDGATGAPRIRTEADSGTAAPLDSRASGAGELLSRDMIGQLIIKLVDRGAQSPGDSLKQSIEIAKLLQGAAAPVAPAFSAEQLADLVAARMGGGRVDQSVDMFTNYERMEGFIQKFRPAAPAAPAALEGGGVNWAAQIPGILQAVIQVIPMLKTLGGPRVPVAVPQAPPPPAARQNGAAQPVQPSMGDRIAEVAALAFAKMSEGVNGFDFAAWLCAWHPGGLEVYQYLEPHGSAGVIGLLAMHPAGAGLLGDPAQRAKLESFLADFFTYDPDGGGESEPAGSAVSPS